MEIFGLIACLFIGISTTVSAKIFSFPNTFSFWFSSLFGIIIILFVVIKFLKQKKKFLYLGMTSLFFIVFLSVNLFARELGSMSAFLPGVFSSFDMLQNFFIFPIMLSFIARYAPQRAQAVYQAIAFFLFSLSTIMVKNTLPLITLSGSYLILFLSILIILIVAGFFRVVYKNYK